MKHQRFFLAQRLWPNNYSMLLISSLRYSHGAISKRPCVWNRCNYANAKTSANDFCRLLGPHLSGPQPLAERLGIPVFAQIQ